jgi:hypothetical protein
MSTQSLQSVLSRAMVDADFADLLFSDPDRALAGFDLTADEIATLKGMGRTTVDQLAKALPEDRKSFSIFIDR